MLDEDRDAIADSFEQARASAPPSKAKPKSGILRSVSSAESLSEYSSFLNIPYRGILLDEFPSPAYYCLRMSRNRLGTTGLIQMFFVLSAFP